MMEFLRKYINIKAESILESVIALSIISICLYISVLVYTAVFTPKTSSKFYISRNKVSSLYYQSQIYPDSLEFNDESFLIEKEWLSTSLQKIKIKSKDTLLNPIAIEYYLSN